MIAYKGMCPGMVCLGYQLKMGLNVTEQANCQANGFHCAANPMDCLRYYGDFQNSEYYLVRPCGDLDEDAVDSRISCTQLWVLRKLEPQEFFLHALAYMADHPQMPDGCDVKRERAQAWNGYAVVRYSGICQRSCERTEDRASFAVRDRRQGASAGYLV